MKLYSKINIENESRISIKKEIFDLIMFVREISGIAKRKLQWGLN